MIVKETDNTFNLAKGGQKLYRQVKGIAHVFN
jgi:hypothetical protein